MSVEPFADQYEHAARLSGVSVPELKRRDDARPLPWKRWVSAKAMVTATRRPDNRWFLSFVGRAADCQRLADAAGEIIESALHANAEVGTSIAEALLQAGFETEMESERFEVDFERALNQLRRAWMPRAYATIDVAGADHDRVFDLDNMIRNEVPGTDGWLGNRQMFDKELKDPAAYRIAIHRETGDHVGLVRIWRNDSGPYFGLIGVEESHRRTLIAAGLARRGLEDAATWGHDSFTTHTSLSNRVIYPKMARLGARSLGRFLQLVRRAP